jgi:molybdenum cofactor cytidylyltransferase
LGAASGTQDGPVTALLLAAGESTRMGQPKPLLEWMGRRLVEYQIEELLGAGIDEVIVVLGHRADEVRPLAERAGARAVFNPSYREGRAGSIRTGAAAARDDSRVIAVLNVDQPRGRRVIRAVLEGHRDSGSLITVPSYQGRHGHPAVFAGQLLSELRSVDEASEGLRAINRRHLASRGEIPVDDPAVLLDLNRPSDYEAARLDASMH